MWIKYSGIKKIKFQHLTTHSIKNLSSNKIAKIQENPLSHRDFNKIRKLFLRVKLLKVLNFKNSYRNRIN